MKREGHEETAAAEMRPVMGDSCKDGNDRDTCAMGATAA